MQLAALAIVPITCFTPTEYWHLLVLLPIFGFCTLGLHAGFAVYFPELFPTRLRATAAGICFNGGRLLSAVVLVFAGWLKSQVDLPVAVSLLGLLFVAGIVIVFYLPETKGQPLPE
jgi:MFS family permease